MIYKSYSLFSQSFVLIALLLFKEILVVQKQMLNPFYLFICFCRTQQWIFWRWVSGYLILCMFLVNDPVINIVGLWRADCAKHDPEVNEDTEKNYAELLTEELKQREAASMEKHKRVDTGLLEAKKITSSYQKEADKCNSGMETCEEAREKSEKALVEQKKLTSMWELRARQKGWKEGATKSSVKSKSSVQAS